MIVVLEFLANDVHVLVPNTTKWSRHSCFMFEQIARRKQLYLAIESSSLRLILDLATTMRETV